MTYDESYELIKSHTNGENFSYTVNSQSDSIELKSLFNDMEGFHAGKEEVLGIKKIIINIKCNLDITSENHIFSTYLGKNFTRSIEINANRKTVNFINNGNHFSIWLKGFNDIIIKNMTFNTYIDSVPRFKKVELNNCTIKTDDYLFSSYIYTSLDLKIKNCTIDCSYFLGNFGLTGSSDESEEFALIVIDKTTLSLKSFSKASITPKGYNINIRINDSNVKLGDSLGLTLFNDVSHIYMVCNNTNFENTEENTIGLFSIYEDMEKFYPYSDVFSAKYVFNNCIFNSTVPIFYCKIKYHYLIRKESEYLMDFNSCYFNCKDRLVNFIVEDNDNADSNSGKVRINFNSGIANVEEINSDSIKDYIYDNENYLKIIDKGKIREALTADILTIDRKEDFKLKLEKEDFYEFKIYTREDYKNLEDKIFTKQDKKEFFLSKGVKNFRIVFMNDLDLCNPPASGDDGIHIHDGIYYLWGSAFSDGILEIDYGGNTVTGSFNGILYDVAVRNNANLTTLKECVCFKKIAVKNGTFLYKEPYTYLIFAADAEEIEFKDFNFLPQSPNLYCYGLSCPNIYNLYTFEVKNKYRFINCNFENIDYCTLRHGSACFDVLWENCKLSFKNFSNTQTQSCYCGDNFCYEAFDKINDKNKIGEEVQVFRNCEIISDGFQGTFHAAVSWGISQKKATFLFENTIFISENTPLIGCSNGSPRGPVTYGNTEMTFNNCTIKASKLIDMQYRILDVSSPKFGYVNGVLTSIPPTEEEVEYRCKNHFILNFNNTDIETVSKDKPIKIISVNLDSGNVETKEDYNFMIVNFNSGSLTTASKYSKIEDICEGSWKYFNNIKTETIRKDDPTSIKFVRLEDFKFNGGSYIFPLRNAYNFTNPFEKVKKWSKGQLNYKQSGKWMLRPPEDADGNRECYLNLETQRWPTMLPGMYIIQGSWDLRADGLTAPNFDFQGQSTAKIKFKTTKPGLVKATINWGSKMRTGIDYMMFTLSNDETPPKFPSCDKYYTLSGDDITRVETIVEKELSEGECWLHMTLYTSSPTGLDFYTTYTFIKDVTLNGQLFIGNLGSSFEPIVFAPDKDWNLDNTWLKMNGTWNGEKKITEIKKGENNVIQ